MKEHFQGPPSLNWLGYMDKTTMAGKVEGGSLIFGPARVVVHQVGNGVGLPDFCAPGSLWP